MKRTAHKMKRKDLNPSGTRGQVEKQLTETLAKLHELRADEKRAQSALADLDALRERQAAHLSLCIAAQREFFAAPVGAAGGRAAATVKPCALTANSARDAQEPDSPRTKEARQALRVTAAATADKETALRALRQAIGQFELRRDAYRAEIGSLSANLPPDVSDHAVLGYLAATQGIDVQAIRAAIVSARLIATVDALGDGFHPIDSGSTLVAHVKNRVILAVNETAGSDAAGRDAAHGKRPNARLTRARLERMNAAGDEDFDGDYDQTWAPGHGGRALQTPLMRRAVGAR